MDEIDDLFAPPADSDYACSGCGRVYRHPGPCHNPWRWLWLRLVRAET